MDCANELNSRNHAAGASFWPYELPTISMTTVGSRPGGSKPHYSFSMFPKCKFGNISWTTQLEPPPFFFCSADLPIPVTTVHPAPSAWMIWPWPCWYFGSLPAHRPTPRGVTPQPEGLRQHSPGWQLRNDERESNKKHGSCIHLIVVIKNTMYINKMKPTNPNADTYVEKQGFNTYLSQFPANPLVEHPDLTHWSDNLVGHPCLTLLRFW